ncbi:MAG: ASPIC/UnbV domain-containing protein [Segetibacter sp.]
MLEKQQSIDTLQVTWPDGKVQVMANVKTDQAITLKNSDASLAGKYF